MAWPAIQTALCDFTCENAPENFNVIAAFTARNVSIRQPHVENAELAKLLADDLQGGISQYVGRLLRHPKLQKAQSVPRLAVDRASC
jgi:hypothetical protein